MKKANKKVAAPKADFSLVAKSVKTNVERLIQVDADAKAIRAEFNADLQKRRVPAKFFKAPKKGVDSPKHKAYFEYLKSKSTQYVLDSLSVPDLKLVNSDPKVLSKTQKERRKKIQQQFGSKLKDWFNSYNLFLQAKGSKLAFETPKANKSTDNTSEADKLVAELGDVPADKSIEKIVKELSASIVRMQKLDTKYGDINGAIAATKRAIASLIEPNH